MSGRFCHREIRSLTCQFPYRVGSNLRPYRRTATLYRCQLSACAVQAKARPARTASEGSAVVLVRKATGWKKAGVPGRAGCLSKPGRRARSRHGARSSQVPIGVGEHLPFPPGMTCWPRFWYPPV